jgi:hypothetical protein
MLGGQYVCQVSYRSEQSWTLWDRVKFRRRRTFIFSLVPEEADTTVSRIVSKYFPVDPVSHLRRPGSSSTQLWEPQTSLQVYSLQRSIVTLLSGHFQKFSASYELWLRSSWFDRYMPSFRKDPMRQVLAYQVISINKWIRRFGNVGGYLPSCALYRITKHNNLWPTLINTWDPLELVWLSVSYWCKTEWLCCILANVLKR